MRRRPGATLCVFVKPPIAGRVKTRLQPAITAGQSAELSSAFFADALVLAHTCGWARVIVACDGDPKLLGMDAAVKVRQQGTGDLGERMERVLRQALLETPTVIAIGTDSPGLPRRFLDEARKALEDHDAVVGPTDDGGYYLLGLRHCCEGLLRGLPWSSPATRKETVTRLVSSGLSVAETEPWFDVDRPADLMRLADGMRQGDIFAPHTARALATLATQRVTR